MTTYLHFKRAAHFAARFVWALPVPVDVPLTQVLADAGVAVVAANAPTLVTITAAANNVLKIIFFLLNFLFADCCKY